MDKVRTELDAGVFTITLADPDNKNALSRQLTAELNQAMSRVEDDDEIRVVVLTNEGNTFCAGADLGRIAGHAVAGGLGLAACTDISVALDTAKMGFSEVRIGVAPAIISVICLPKMRQGEASEAFLRGNRFTAVEGARLGLVNYAVPAEELDAKVDEIVGDLVLGGRRHEGLPRKAQTCLDT